MDTHSPPHFNGNNFSYYSVRMVCYLEVVGLGVWTVTLDGMNPLEILKSSSQVKKKSF
jgi:hypothetical protein